MDVLEPEFQTELVRAMVQDHSFLPKYRRRIDADLFRNGDEQRVVSVCLEYFDKYAAHPGQAVIRDLLRKRGLVAEDASDVVNELNKRSPKSVDYIADQLHDFQVKNNMKAVLLGCMGHLKEGNYEAIFKDVRKAINELDNETGVGKLFLEDAKNVIAAVGKKEKFVPMGIPELDEKLSGGGARGTLNVILTPPNKGKTSTLINIGKFAFMAGYRVDHITTELSEQVTQRRYIQSITGFTKKELKDRKRSAYDKILELAQQVAKENLIIKRYPSYSCPVSQIEAHWRQIKDLYGFYPDVSIIDYAALLRPAKSYDERRHELSNIYATLRDLMYENDIVGWTAHQTNREGNKGEVITINDLAEDFGIAAITDVIISVNQTMEERRDGEARLFLAKNRDDDALITIPIRVDWTKIQIRGLND